MIITLQCWSARARREACSVIYARNGAARIKEINESAMMNEEMRMLMKTMRMKEGAKKKESRSLRRPALQRGRSKRNAREAKRNNEDEGSAEGAGGEEEEEEEEGTGTRRRARGEEGERSEDEAEESEREQYAHRRKHLHLIIDRLSIALPVLSAVPTLRDHYVAVCFWPLKTHPVVARNRQVLLPGRQVQAAQVPFRFNDTLSHTSAGRRTRIRARAGTFYLPFFLSDPSEFPLAVPPSWGF